jgi:hypothetical protein
MLVKVADLNTAIPGGMGDFTNFVPPNPASAGLERSQKLRLIV